MLKGVLFDLGDTLQEYRDEDWGKIVRALNEDLYIHLVEQGHRHRLPPLDAFLELINTTLQAHRARAAATLESHSMQEVLESFFKDQQLHDLRAEEYMQPWYQRISDLGFVPIDVKPTLQLLKRKGLKLGLVSNTGWTSAFHDPDLERFGIKDLLECRIYSCEVGWEKPAPQIFHAALDCLGLQPEETAFVGDFLRYDVAGAHDVGMKAIWKKMDNRPYEVDDHSIEPDAIVGRISEVPAALEKLYAQPSTHGPTPGVEFC